MLGLLVFAATIVMLVGMLGMPADYYAGLRTLVCVTAVVGLFKARTARLETWVWAFGVVAVVYNPFVPLYLRSRGLWTIVNLVTIALLWNGRRAVRGSA